MWLPGKSGLDRAQSGFDHGCIARVGCPRNRTDTETEGGCSNSHRASEPAGNTCPRSPRATSACTPPHQAPTAAWLRENNDVAGVNLSTNGSYSVVIQACSHSPSRPAIALLTLLRRRGGWQTAPAVVAQSAWCIRRPDGSPGLPLERRRKMQIRLGCMLVWVWMPGCREEGRFLCRS